MTNGSYMKVKSIAECSPWSILQYFWPTLSDNWSWKPISGLFESGRLTQVLLYSKRKQPQYFVTNENMDLLLKFLTIFILIDFFIYTQNQK